MSGIHKHTDLNNTKLSTSDFLPVKAGITGKAGSIRLRRVQMSSSSQYMVILKNLR